MGLTELFNDLWLSLFHWRESRCQIAMLRCKIECLSLSWIYSLLNLLNLISTNYCWTFTIPPFKRDTYGLISLQYPQEMRIQVSLSLITYAARQDLYHLLYSALFFVFWFKAGRLDFFREIYYFEMYEFKSSCFESILSYGLCLIQILVCHFVMIQPHHAIHQFLHIHQLILKESLYL